MTVYLSALGIVALRVQRGVCNLNAVIWRNSTSIEARMMSLTNTLIFLKKATQRITSKHFSWN